MAELNKTTLLSNINLDLADNNSGAISAEDVRSCIYDTTESINIVVASGNTDTLYPFYADVRAKITTPLVGDPSGGKFIAESGIQFPNHSASLQTEPFLGVGGIQHDSLAGLTTGDPHTQYVSISGHRPMTGNLRMGNNWIGASGNSHDGIKFEYHPTGTTIATSGTFKFADNSIIKSGKGVAKAWIIFDGSGAAMIPVVRASYNVTTLDQTDHGKYKIIFASGALGSNNYVAIGSSNIRTSSGSLEDFERGTVGTVSRSGVEPHRTCTFGVLNEQSQYVNAEICQLVVFALGDGVSTESVTVE